MDKERKVKYILRVSGLWTLEYSIEKNTRFVHRTQPKTWCLNVFTRIANQFEIFLRKTKWSQFSCNFDLIQNFMSSYEIIYAKKNSSFARNTWYNLITFIFFNNWTSKNYNWLNSFVDKSLRMWLKSNIIVVVWLLDQSAACLVDWNRLF